MGLNGTIKINGIQGNDREQYCLIASNTLKLHTNVLYRCKEGAERLNQLIVIFSTEKHVIRRGGVSMFILINEIFYAGLFGYVLPFANKAKRKKMAFLNPVGTSSNKNELGN